MTEEIIIDGVNVAGCEFIADTKNGLVKCISWVHNNKNQVSGHWDCRENKNCYYKQLKRLEQENKELKDDYDEISNNSEILHENNCLRIANAKLSEDLCQHGISMREWREQAINYRSALEEIREIAKFNQFYNPEDLLINGDIGQMQDLKMTEIYEKINEVLK